jgi:hypothetical protein
MSKCISYFNVISCGLLAVFVSGCATSQSLSTLDRSKIGKVSLGQVKGTDKSSYGSDVAQSSLLAIGGLSGLLAATISESGGQGELNKIRESTGNFEKNVVREKINAELSRSGYVKSGATTTLDVHLDRYGIYKNGDGLASTYITVSAKLKSTKGETLWNATSNARCRTLRTLDEYKSNPKFYRADFESAASDAARQLVSGPIGNVATGALRGY